MTHSFSNSRDQLALERTKLANERTFLAYIRTSLSLLAAGALIIQFFFEQPYYLLTASILFGLGVIVLVAGAIRFIQVKKQLNNKS